MLPALASAACSRIEVLERCVVPSFRHLRRASTIHRQLRLTFQDIDARWQRRWSLAQQASLPPTSDPGRKAYILSMFPYPSGSLHMGHLRVYTISDVLSRYRRMKGDDVLHPMGWDAFGLPAENAAIERRIDPAVWTGQNISKMKEQLSSMNAEFDWSREFRTCSPSFYKHTQMIFLMLHRRGLAYQAEAMVNYDPVDKTVLANEQVDANGRSWRSGAAVVQLKLKQWFFRITAFQEALLDGLVGLERGGNWPERVIAQQRHWLGRSAGAKIRFATRDGPDQREQIEVFTTRPDTLFGVSYIALSLTHPLVQQKASSSDDLRAFIQEAAKAAPDSKMGFRLPGVVATNPLASLTNANVRGTELPIYVAPYVLGGYGAGAVMGVPGHDSRDHAFWCENNDEPHQIINVINPRDSPPHAKAKESSVLSPSVVPFAGRGILNELCGPYAGFESDDGGKKIVSDLEAHGGLAEPGNTWRLRDWLVSRQRYWGTPIPIIHCKQCGAVPVPEDQLPVELPRLDEPVKGQTGNSLEKVDSWVNTRCPSCNGHAMRDTDTMDTFVDSSWYFMRFPDAKNDKEPFSPQSAQSMLPVDTYVGGIEHAILHLLYARFIHKFLASEDLIPSPKGAPELAAEPFRQLISQGMVHGKTFSDPETARFLHPDEVSGADTPNPVIKATGLPPVITWEKMSKSKYNGVDPSACVAKYGADATRTHILFAAPVSEVLDWDEEKIIGIQRWFSHVSSLVSRCRDMSGRDGLPTPSNFTDPAFGFMAPDVSDSAHGLHADDVETLLTIHNAIKSVTHTFEKNIYGLNTAVSDLIKLTNALHTAGPTSAGRGRKGGKEQLPQIAGREKEAVRRTSLGVYYGLSVLLRMLAPVAPAFAEQCWEDLHLPRKTDDVEKAPHQEAAIPSIFRSPFPSPILDDATVALLVQQRKTKTCAVQINGKLRFTVQVPSEPDRPEHAARTDAPPSSSSSAEELLTGKILETEEGRLWLTQKNDWGRRKKVIVVGGGKLVNIVF